jgi:phytol kinase
MKYELLRKILHIITSVKIAFLIYFEIIKIWQLALGIFIIFNIYLILINLRISAINHFFKKINRNNKDFDFGFLSFFLGILLVWIIFHKNPEIVVASIMILCFGDSFAGIFGKKYGKTKHPYNKEKTIEGTIFGIIGGFIGASFFVLPLYAFITSFFAIILESFFKKDLGGIIDDNLIIPTFSGIILYIII